MRVPQPTPPQRSVVNELPRFDHFIMLDGIPPEHRRRDRALVPGVAGRRLMVPGPHLSPGYMFGDCDTCGRVKLVDQYWLFCPSCAPVWAPPDAGQRFMSEDTQ